MGKHFWIKHVDNELDHKQPGCMWGLVHALDYHHWSSNVRKMIQRRKYEGQANLNCDWSPKTEASNSDAYEVEKPQNEKQIPSTSTKRSHLASKQSPKARIKTLVAEEISKESDNIQRKEGFSLRSSLQRTHSIHHLESLDGGLGEICVDWKHQIIFVPRNEENDATQSLVTTQAKPAGKHDECSGKSNIFSSEDPAKPQHDEDPDVLEIFKVDKKLFIKNLQVADQSLANFSRSALGLNKKPKLSKSRSFPLAELFQRRKFKPAKLENKHKEVWSFPKGEKFKAVYQAPSLVRPDHFGTRSGELAGDGSDGIQGQDMMIGQVLQTRNEVIMSLDNKVDQGKSERALLAVKHNKLPDMSIHSAHFEDIDDRKEENGTESVGEKLDEYSIRQSTHHRSYSLNESLDKYAWLFENSYPMDVKLHPSKSLKLTNEFSHAPICFGRIFSLPNVESSSDLNHVAVGDDLFQNGLFCTAKYSTSGPQNSVAEDSRVRLLTHDGENFPLGATEAANTRKNPVDGSNCMQTMEDDARLRLNTSDDDNEMLESFNDEADKLNKSYFCKELKTNCSDITHKEFLDQCFSLDSDTSPEKIIHFGKLQISKGLECRCSHFDELKSSFDSDNRKSLHRESSTTNSSILNLENAENSDKIIKCFGDDLCLKENNSDLYYVRHLLEHSGIALDASERKWQASNQPLSLQLFEEVEACFPHEQDQLTGFPDFCGRSRHQMLFDLVNEVLLEVHDISLPYYPKALSSSCHICPFPVGNHMIGEVSTNINKLLSMEAEEKQLTDCIVAYDLVNDKSWMNLQMESECMALELEDMIFDELLQEFICH